MSMSFAIFAASVPETVVAEVQRELEQRSPAHVAGNADAVTADVLDKVATRFARGSSEHSIIREYIARLGEQPDTEAPPADSSAVELSAMEAAAIRLPRTGRSAATAATKAAKTVAKAAGITAATTATATLGVSDSDVESILTALKNASAPIVDLGSEIQGDAGVLVLAGLDVPTLNAVSEMTRGGAKCLVVVAASVAEFPNDGAYALRQAGAMDVLTWDPQQQAAFIKTLKARVAEYATTEKKVGQWQDRSPGTSGAWKTTLREVFVAATRSRAPIALSGSRGTPLVDLAELAHDADPNTTKGDLVVVNCAAMEPELQGSELFGHERGAFDGAVSQRDGGIALADGGTLVLENPAGLSLSVQNRLLAFLRGGTFKRLGGNAWQRSDARVISTTHEDLESAVVAGRLLPELCTALTGVEIAVPALQARSEDVPALVRYFVCRATPKDKKPPELDAAVQVFLETRSYQGGVEELERLVRQMMNRHGGGPLLSMQSVPSGLL